MKGWPSRSPASADVAGARRPRGSGSRSRPRPARRPARSGSRRSRTPRPARERRGVACALVAEAEVVADHGVPDAEPAGQHVVDERLGLLVIRCRLKASANRCSTPSSASRRALIRNGVSRGGALSGVRTSRGCGSKVTTPSGAPSSRARARAAPDQGAMAAMHAVEIADRHDPVQGGLRQAPVAPVNPHRRLMPAARLRCKGPRGRASGAGSAISQGERGRRS